MVLVLLGCCESEDCLVVEKCREIEGGGGCVGLRQKV